MSELIKKQGYCSIDDCNEPTIIKLQQKAVKHLEENWSAFLTYTPTYICTECVKWLKDEELVKSLKEEYR